jgi:hypothetical protein
MEGYDDDDYPPNAPRDDVEYMSEMAPGITVDDSPISTEGETYRNGLKALAAVVAFRLGNKYPELKNLGDGALPRVPHFMQHFAKRGMVAPSDEWLYSCYSMDKLFFHIHDEGICTDKGILDRFLKMVKAAKTLSVPRQVARLFGWLRLCVRIRCLNRLKKKDRATVLAEAEVSKMDPQSRASKTARIWLS